MIQLDMSFTLTGPSYLIFYPYYLDPNKKNSEDLLVVMHSKIVKSTEPRFITTAAQYVEEYGNPSENFPHAWAVCQALEICPGVLVYALPLSTNMADALSGLANSEYEHAAYLKECIESMGWV